jgi:hypothetical protein
MDEGTAGAEAGRPGFSRRRSRVNKASAPESSKAQWLRLWSVARYDLRLSDAEFYALIPRQLDALVKRKERETEANEFLFGQLTSYLINFSMARPKRAVSPADFMPSQWGKKPRQIRKRKMTKRERDRIAARLNAFFSPLPEQK